LKLAARVGYLNDDFFFSAPQLKRDPLGGQALFVEGVRVPSSSFSDPQEIRSLATRIQRFVPRWLVLQVLGAFMDLFVFFRVESLNKQAPTHLGVHIWPEGGNADLQLERVKAALDLIRAHAPIYLRWLGSRFHAVVVSQLFMVMRTVSEVDVRRRMFCLNPYTVWNVSSEQLALYLVAGATRGRLGRRFMRRFASDRANRRVLEEMVAFARHLPAAEALVAQWERHLAEFSQRHPEPAA